MPLGLRKEALRGLHEERFNNLAALTRKTPVAVLHLSLVGTFCREMDRMLDECSRTEAEVSAGVRKGGGRRSDPRLAAP